MILTVTMNPAVDKSTETEKLLPEKKLRCNELLVEAGGGGINVSKAIQKLGGESLAIFPSAGANGKLLEEKLAGLNIKFKTISYTGNTRENIVVRETATNAQYRFVMPGTTLSSKEADECIRMVKECQPKPSIIVASGSLPPGIDESFFASLARVAKETNAKYIVDTSGSPLKLAAEQGVYLLKPNLHELSNLVGKDSLDIMDVDDAAMEVIHKGQCEVIVVSLGPAGALLVTSQGYEHIPAPTVAKKTTVGAGDSTVAGMVWMLSQGKSLREAVRFGVACGSAATMNTGTQLFNRADAMKLYDWINQHAEKYKLNLDN
ncbi:MAG TPA: 1-phosphofructokinase family hexose kinase [Flavitalea sp.]|nr:1-phosphofructokinase family hexose kinase [Flavitalea sp.]